MSLRHALLGLLCDRESDGPGLVRRFEASLAHVWPAAQSQIYRELAMLRIEGLIGPATAGARRRGVVYAATDAGRSELHRWLTGPLPTPRPRDEALLMALFLSNLDPGDAAARLDGQAWRAARHGAELEALRRAMQAGRSPLAQDGGLALEYGIRAARMQGEWAAWAAEQLTAHKPRNTHRTQEEAGHDRPAGPVAGGTGEPALQG